MRIWCFHCAFVLAHFSNLWVLALWFKPFQEDEACKEFSLYESKLQLKWFWKYFAYAGIVVCVCIFNRKKDAGFFFLDGQGEQILARIHLSKDDLQFWKWFVHTAEVTPEITFSNDWTPYAEVFLGLTAGFAFSFCCKSCRHLPKYFLFTCRFCGPTTNGTGKRQCALCFKKNRASLFRNLSTKRRLGIFAFFFAILPTTTSCSQYLLRVQCTSGSQWSCKTIPMCESV